MMESKRVRELLGVDRAIIQAPMAGGITTPDLVAEVSAAGGLGMIAGGSLAPDDLRSLIRETGGRTGRNFGVNLFIPRNFEVTDSDIENAFRLLRPAYDAFGLEQEPVTPAAPGDIREKFDRQLDVVLEEEVPVISLIFGVQAADPRRRLNTF